MLMTIRACILQCLLVCGLYVVAAGPVSAQQPVWVQVEAQPTLTSAQNRVRAYAAEFDDVAGFYLGSGWYGIVLGPYSRADATSLLANLRQAGRIPSDSFIATGGAFQQQFWPIGVAAETTAQALPPQSTSGEAPATPPTSQPAPTPPPAVTIPDETPQQARASEALLSRPEREELQIALQWAGFYQSSIDGAFGRGTRSSMAAWQEANNHEPTGVLTSRQRIELLAAYNAVLDGMDLQMIRDDATGVEIMIPTGVVAFAGYEPPFARFDAKGDLDAAVLLISQEGDQTRMFGLYEILQTLDIVPLEGPRSRSGASFEIEGTDATRHTYISVGLRDGQIKGFALIWPANDEDRRSRILAEMQASFSRIGGVLDPGIAPPDENQAIDLVAGLSVRQPRLSRSGFYVDRSGTVVTSQEAVQGCERITLDGSFEARVVHEDPALGLAAVQPVSALAPMGVVSFQTAVPRLQSEVAVAGYPYGGVLRTPSLTFGRLADLRGLNGEETIKRLSLASQPGDTGGPVFDNGGAVLGMLLPVTARNGQVLPADVRFAADAEQIVASLSAAGLSVTTTDSLTFMPPETLTRRAADVTVLVSCW